MTKDQVPKKRSRGLSVNPSHKSRHWPVVSRWFAKIAVIPTLLALALLLGAACGTPTPTPTPPPVLPRLEIDGPNKLKDGVTTEYKVKYFRKGSALPQSVEVRIDEDDAFDDTLVKKIVISLAAGVSTDEGKFDLTCKWQGAGWDLIGIDDTSKNENPQMIHAEESSAAGVVSPNHTITCEGGGGKPKSVKIVDQSGNTRITLTVGDTETLTVVLEMTDLVTTNETHKFRIDESDTPIDDTIQKVVDVIVPAREKEGRGDFQVTCINWKGPKWDLEGDDDTSKDEDFHQLQAEGVVTSILFFVVNCQPPEETEENQ